jgi:hypothetical protein
MIFVIIDSKRRRLTLGASSLGLLAAGILLLALA